MPTTKAMRFSVSARDGETNASETSANTSARLASRSLGVIFMMIFAPEEPISNAMLRRRAEQDLNETRWTEGEDERAGSPYRKGTWRDFWPSQRDGIDTLTNKWAGVCASSLGHEAHLLCPPPIST